MCCPIFSGCPKLSTRAQPCLHPLSHQSQGRPQISGRRRSRKHRAGSLLNRPWLRKATPLPAFEWDPAEQPGIPGRRRRQQVAPKSFARPPDLSSIWAAQTSIFVTVRLIENRLLWGPILNGHIPGASEFHASRGIEDISEDDWRAAGLQESQLRSRTGLMSMIGVPSIASKILHLKPAIPIYAQNLRREILKLFGISITGAHMPVPNCSALACATRASV